MTIEKFKVYLREPEDDETMRDVIDAITAEFICVEESFTENEKGNVLIVSFSGSSRQRDEFNSDLSEDYRVAGVYPI